MVECIVGGGLDLELFASSEIDQLKRIIQLEGYARYPGSGLATATILLRPPNEEKIFDDLVLDSIFSRRILKKFKRVRDPLRLEVAGRAFAESQAQAIA